MRSARAIRGRRWRSCAISSSGWRKTDRARKSAAEVEWREGGIAALAAARYPAQAEAYQRVSLDAFARALERAPNEEKYLLNYAGAAIRTGNIEASLRTFERAAQVVPDSVDAFAGVACAAADARRLRWRRARARARATASQPQQHRTVDVAGHGYAPDVRAALARCER